MEKLNTYILDKLNSIHEEYYALKLVDNRSYKIMNIYNKIFGTIVPYPFGEKGAYIDLDEHITDLSLDEVSVILEMLSIVNEYEK